MKSLTIMLGISIAVYYICSFRTVIQVYKNDWKIILEAQCLAFSVFQGAVKLASALIQRQKYYDTTELIQKLFQDYETRGKRYATALDENCTSIRRIMKIVLFCYLLGDGGIEFVPLTFRAFTGAKYLIMQFYFPGIDIATTSGYYITAAIHTIFIYNGVFGLFASDMLTITFLMQAFLFSEIFKLKVEDLNEVLDNEEVSGDIVRIREMLIDIVKWHQLYKEFTETCNEIFCWVVTVMVTTAGISCLFSLFIILTGSWPGAYPFTLCTFIAYSEPKSKFLQNEEFAYSIYNISWYKLRGPEQKTVRLMLMKSQDAQIMNVAAMYPLSVTLALEITKLLYSYFMFILEFIQK